MSKPYIMLKTVVNAEADDADIAYFARKFIRSQETSSERRDREKRAAEQAKADSRPQLFIIQMRGTLDGSPMLFDENGTCQTSFGNQRITCFSIPATNVKNAEIQCVERVKSFTDFTIRQYRHAGEDWRPISEMKDAVAAYLTTLPLIGVPSAS